jgi:hypothetical protein
VAQRVPQRQRSLRILIDQQTALCCPVRVERKVRGQRALPRPTLSGHKRNDMHTPPTADATDVAIHPIVLRSRIRAR